MTPPEFVRVEPDPGGVLLAVLYMMIILFGGAGMVWLMHWMDKPWKWKWPGS